MAARNLSRVREARFVLRCPGETPGRSLRDRVWRRIGASYPAAPESELVRASHSGEQQVGSWLRIVVRGPSCFSPLVCGGFAAWEARIMPPDGILDSQRVESKQGFLAGPPWSMACHSLVLVLPPRARSGQRVLILKPQPCHETHPLMLRTLRRGRASRRDDSGYGLPSFLIGRLSSTHEPRNGRTSCPGQLSNAGPTIKVTQLKVRVCYLSAHISVSRWFCWPGQSV